MKELTKDRSFISPKKDGVIRMLNGLSFRNQITLDEERFIHNGIYLGHPSELRIQNPGETIDKLNNLSKSGWLQEFPKETYQATINELERLVSEKTCCLSNRVYPHKRVKPSISLF